MLLGIRSYTAIYACMASSHSACVTWIWVGKLIEESSARLTKIFLYTERKSLVLCLLVIIGDDDNYKEDAILVVQNWSGG